MSYTRFLLILSGIIAHVLAFLVIAPTIQDIPNIFWGFAMGAGLGVFFSKE
jgi:hypothetical protein